MNATVGGIHPWDLPDLPADHILATEWKTFKREVQRLLAEGHEGRCVLIKGDVVIGIWDTSRDAYRAGRERLGLEAFLVQPIHSCEVPVRIPRYQ